MLVKFNNRLNIAGYFTSLVLFCIAVPVQAEHHNYLSFGVHPYLPEKEIIKKFLPMNEYLSETLGIPIKIQVARDYESHIERVGSDTLDIAYMGPASYVEMTRRYGKYPLLARLSVKNSPDFHGVIVVRDDSPYRTLTQLKRKRFAFGNVKSTMSYLVPRRMLQDAGVSLDALEAYSFLGNHRNVALSVLLGEYDAGAVKEAIFEEFDSKGLRMLAKSPAISEHVFVASKKLNKTLVIKLRQAMYDLPKNRKGKVILQNIKKTATDLIPASDDNYDSLRQLLMKP